MINIVACTMFQCPYNSKVNEDGTLPVCTKKLISIAPNGMCSQLVKDDGQQRRNWNYKDARAAETVTIVETEWRGGDTDAAEGGPLG